MQIKKYYLLIILSLFNNIFPNAGELDTSFNGTGKVITKFGSNSSEVINIAIDSNGKIIIVGPISNSTDTTTFKYLIGRYNTNGSLDTTFNPAGSVPGTDAQTFDTSGPSVGTDVVLQPDNKIILTGTAIALGSGIKFGLARYNTNGTLDPSFGTGGKVSIPFMQGVNTLQAASFSIALQSDKIIVGGLITDTNYTENFGLARYNTDGTLDATFGNGVTTPGTLREDISQFSFGSNHINAIAIQPDGKILAVGSSADQFALARFNADGSGLDTSFNISGTPGKILNKFPGNSSGGSEATSLLFLSDGSIIIGGDNGASIAFAKYNSDGTIDTNFGVNGFSVLQIPSHNGTAIALQDGKIVAALHVDTGNGFFGVLRLNADGSVDPTFGNMGVVLTNFTSFGAAANAIAVQPNLKIVAGGIAANSSSGSSGTGDVALARYLNSSVACISPADALSQAIQQKYGT